MAKQSFVTGQVLTAQQVNDLQTNDFNQTVSAKTASYTLVAADKGTRITMSSTSATTITVNTGLFAAGDTLFIQNLNTGVATITAGTATVDTSASLALAQHEGGTLYFTSAGVSTFFKSAGAAPSSGSMTQLATGTLSGSGVNITGISGAYTHLYIVIYNAYNTSAASEIALRFNNNSTGIYPFLSQRYTTTTANNGGNASSYLGSESLQYASGSTNNSIDVITVHNYSSTAMTKALEWIRSYFNTQRNTTHIVGAFNTTSAINEVNILEFLGNNFSGGTYIIYGVK